MPQVIVNKAKGKEGMEGLELLRKLAKQVLSQLSYTPTKETTFILNHFRVHRIAEKRAAAERFLAPRTPPAMTVWTEAVQFN
jgi:hypothetical protein